MEIFELVSEAFIRAPFFFIVPILLIAFLAWHPWSERKFYHHPEELADLEVIESE